ncbi:MAG: FHA domain-containing protein, partial [Synergistaceae bacterium]|nr:FHA domain-containing protein [Synergistaceae bacterium]
VFQQSRGVAWDGSVSNELLGVLRTMAKKQKDAALASIGEFSRRSGGQLYRAGISPFASIFDSVAASLDNALALHITLEGLVPDATVKRLEITFSDGTRSLSDGIEFRLTGAAPAQETTDTSPPKTQDPPSETGGLSSWTYILAVAAIIILPLSVLLIQKRRRGAIKGSASPDASEPRAFVPAEESGPTIVLPAPSATTPHRGTASVRVELTPFGARGNEGTIKTVITDRLVLGRSAGQSALAIPGDATISARHCELVVSKGKLFVNDLQSSNGTMVNGVPIQGNYPLEDGDRLTLGKTELRLRIPEVK